MKPKLLIISDSPKISSGMGVAHLEMAVHLQMLDKYDIASFGWFWHHAHNRGITWNLPWPQYTTNDHARPYGHPANWPNSSEDDFKSSAVYQAIEKFKPDVVIGIGDVWMLDYIRKLPNRKSFKFIWEFPIDGEPVPSNWIETVKESDIPVVMSQYAVDALHNVDPLLSLYKIPRGIDLRVFKPITPIVGKDVLRKEMMPKAVGKFVVGMFDRFQDRKQINRGVEAFSKFIKNNKREDAILYLHMDVNDPASVEQGKCLIGDNGILERYGVRNQVIINEDLRVEKGVDVEDLVKLYNCCDVKISSAQGEGWGLTNVEAMACGVPVIATNYTTMPEILAEGRGLLSDVKAFITGMYNVERALVDTDHMAAQIDSLYCSPQLRKFFSDNALRWVPKIQWPIIIRHWEGIIDKCLYKPSYRLLGKSKTYTVNNPLIELSLHGAVRENTGWAITTRGIAQGMESTGVIVNIKESGGVTPGFEPTKEIKEMMMSVESRNVQMINHMPEITVKLLRESKARTKVAFFPFELPKLDTDVVEALNRNADIYLAPSQFCVDMAKAAGVRNAHVLDIHSEIDLDAEPAIINIDKRYKFLCLGNLGDVRKNVTTLVKAYLKTFTGDDDVCLILKSLPGHLNSDPTEFVESESIVYDNPAKVVVIHDEISPSSLYKACDCLVMPSTTEGFCAPIYEALHFGVPVITTGYGGQTCYTKPSDRMIHLPFRMVDAKKSPIYKRGDTWALVDFKALCASMRKMYDTKTKTDPSKAQTFRTWKDTGEQLSKYITTAINTKKINVYFENQERNLWNNDNNVNLKRYAPNRIKFVQDVVDADVQIVNVTRLSDLSKVKCKNYIVLFHCRGEWSEEPIESYKDFFKKALFVYSHQDLKSEIKEPFNFIRGPWGTDTSRFFQTNLFHKRQYKIINTGWVAETEGIDESLIACDLLGVNQLHIGPNLQFKSPSYKFSNNLSNEDMMRAYNDSEFVCGLRRIEGFEKPVIEGLLCGARPICFDTPLFRYWYDGIAEFVPECPKNELIGHLKALFDKGARPVTESEKSLAIKRFGWVNVAINFWDYFEKVYR